MNKKPPELPNIEDATLRACLVPLMDAMQAGAESAMRTVGEPVEPSGPPQPRGGRPEPARLFGSNDNPSPVIADAPEDQSPKTLADWRSLAGDDFGTFRMIEQFLAMPDDELGTAAIRFPKQIGGTVARIARLKRRLATQYDTVTTVLSLLERAMARAASAGAGETTETHIS